jgi:integrase
VAAGFTGIGGAKTKKGSPSAWKPKTRLKPPQGRKNWIEQSKVNEIIAAATDSDLKFVLHCGFNTGLRRKEIIEARAGWFSVSAGLLRVFSGNGLVTKDKEGRSIPLKRKFKEFLQTYLAGKDRDD